MATTPTLHDYLLDLADENLREFSVNAELNSSSRAYQALSLVGLLLGEIPEAQLRTFLAIAGLDLNNPDDLMLATEAASLFEHAGIVFVTDKFVHSLVDPEEGLRSWLSADEETEAWLEKVKGDGILFREITAPSMYARS